ncbi:hypothetical protein [Saccharicrinis sp. FJH54]|uniref:hypothetical protein n=1 Tax=Saccharicrinis sp. FJH54 TaxID=3344665 RepID=UPI0035D47E99
MKNLLLSLFIGRYIPCIFFAFILYQPTLLQAQTDTISAKNSLKAGNYGMGLSSQVSGTSKLNLFGQPLIILDGMPYYTFSSDIINYTTTDLSDIANMLGISEEEIESVTILTDPTELMSFGSAARNGAIYITTKKASDTKLNINYSLKTRVSWEKAAYDVLSGEQYATLIKEAYMNGYGTPLEVYTHKELLYQPTEPYYYYNFGQNTNWFKEITQTGFLQEHTLSLNGSVKGIGYRASTMFRKGKGTIINTGSKDYNFRLLLDYKIKNIGYVSAGLNYNKLTSENCNIPETFSDIRELALRMMPNMSVYEYSDEGEKTSKLFLPSRSFQGYNFPNPVAYAEYSENNILVSQLTPVINIELNPLKALLYNFKLDFNQFQIENNVINPYLFNIFSFDQIAENISSTNHKNGILNIRNTFTYQLLTKKNQKLSISGEYHFQSTKNIIKETETGFSSQYIYDPIVYNEKSNMFLAGLHYNLLDRYLFEINGSSERIKIANKKLDRTYNYGVHAEWIISNEPFFKQNHVLNHTALNASLGSINFPGAYYTEAYKYIPSSTLRLNTEGIEQTLRKEANLYLEILNHTSTLNISYFQNSLKNSPVPTILQPASGYSDVFGLTQNTEIKGWAINLSTKIVKQTEFLINFFMQLDWSKKYIAEKNYPTSFTLNELWDLNYLNHVNTQNAFGEITGLKYMGVYQYDTYIAGSQENAPVARDVNGNIIRDINGYPVPVTYKANDVNYIFQGGDAKYQDQNFDGTIDENDLVVIGNTRPLLTGTFGPDLTYKRFWLGTFFNFSYGNDVVNLTGMNLVNMYSTSNQSVETLDRWRTPGDVTTMPRALLSSGYNNLASTRFVEDGSFLRLKALTLKYALPEHICRKLHLTSLSFYATGKNLITWTKYNGADPDINLNTDWYNYGFDSNYAVPIREVIFGINVGL